MLVNDTHRVIYLDHPRTASTSTTKFLESVGFKRYELEKGQHGTQHKVREGVRLLHPWGAYTKFTTVRNHHDIIASWMIPRNTVPPPPTPWTVKDVLEALAYPLGEGWIDHSRMFPLLDHAHYCVDFKDVVDEVPRLIEWLGVPFFRYEFPHIHGEWRLKRPHELINCYDLEAWEYINDRFHWERELMAEKLVGYTAKESFTRCSCGRRI